MFTRYVYSIVWILFNTVRYNWITGYNWIHATVSCLYLGLGFLILLAAQVAGDNTGHNRFPVREILAPLCTANRSQMLSHVSYAVFRICIGFNADFRSMRIRTLIQIQGFKDQKLKENFTASKNYFFIYKKLQLT